MKSIKFFAIAALLLMLASCASYEVDSVDKRKNNGMTPLEFSPAVKVQTRAGQIYSDNLNKLYMTTVGTFYSAAGAVVENPTLELTKGEQGWSYTYGGSANNTILYWPMEGLQNAEFRAWYYDGDTAVERGELNNKAATLDAVGAYTKLDYVSGEKTVPLSMYHAVSKAEFKTKVLTKSADGPYKIKVDVKGVCLHNMGYKASAYVLPKSETQMGAFTVTNDKRDLLVNAAQHAFIGQSSNPATIGSMFVMPQAIDAQNLADDTWTKPYISILAQVRVDEENNEVPIFPKNAGVDDYAWLAVQLPAEFAGFEAHHKYIFTINLRDDAMGKADRDQYPNKEEMDDPNTPTVDDQPCGPNTEDLVPVDDRGKDVIIEGRSAFPLVVTVEDVFDFDEYPDGQEPATEIEINEPLPSAPAFVFSVSGSSTVQFSSGNLFYNNGAWGFESTPQYGQYNDSPGYISVFGWGANGATSSGGINIYDIINHCEADALGGADWGAVVGEQDGATGWRTLTKDEWSYLLEERDNHANLNGLGKVGDVNGLILLPDNWTLPDGCTFTPGIDAGWNANAYTADQWSAMQSAGAVFLPAAGFRAAAVMDGDDEKAVYNKGLLGWYWSSTAYEDSEQSSYNLFFIYVAEEPYYALTMDYNPGNAGCSVRLVRDIQ